MKQPANTSPEGPPSRFADMLGSAFFWAVAALPLSGLFWHVLAKAHVFLGGDTAAQFWGLVSQRDHPLYHLYDTVWLLLPAGVLWWWLGFRNVRAEAAPIGDQDRWAVCFAVAGAVAYLVADYVIGAVLVAIFGWGPEVYYRDMEYLAEVRELQLMALIPGVIAAPVFEELAFRGLMLGVLLARGWNPFAAIALTAAIFAFTHQQYAVLGLFAIFIGGFILGLLRVATGGLFAPTLCHALVNFMLLTPTSA